MLSMTNEKFGISLEEAPVETSSVEEFSLTLTCPECQRQAMWDG